MSASSPLLAPPRVVILCGGQGTRMREETEFRPKPMVDIGGRPMLWHIMKLYAAHGLKDFVLCLGYRGEMIKQYFADYYLHNSDVTFELATGDAEYHAGHREDWRVTLVDTGTDAMTGARVKRVEPYLADADLFLCTYGDGVSDVDIPALLDFHRAHGKLATVTGVRSASRFGRLASDGVSVTTFSEKPHGELINGGFFVFDARVLGRLSADPGCVLEQEPLERLAADGELAVFEHDGYWQCADTLRDVETLRELWQSGAAPWRVWNDRQPAAIVQAGRRRDDLAVAAA